MNVSFVNYGTLVTQEDGKEKMHVPVINCTCQHPQSWHWRYQNSDGTFSFGTCTAQCECNWFMPEDFTSIIEAAQKISKDEDEDD